jgi:hypothetical protein
MNERNTVRVSRMKGSSLRQRNDVSVREVDKETIVLDRAGEQIHQLNKTASFIWNRLDGQTRQQKISTQYAKEFGVDLRTAREDTARMIREFRELHLLEET